jgi:hypothetical protein
MRGEQRAPDDKITNCVRAPFSVTTMATGDGRGWLRGGSSWGWTLLSGRSTRMWRGVVQSRMWTTLCPALFKNQQPTLFSRPFYSNSSPSFPNPRCPGAFCQEHCGLRNNVESQGENAHEMLPRRILWDHNTKLILHASCLDPKGMS